MKVDSERVTEKISERSDERNEELNTKVMAIALEDDSEDDSLGDELDKIGRSVSFTMPNLSQLKNFKLFNNVETPNDISISDFLLDQQLTQIFSKRRDQLTEFINDLTSGFSIQNALERLQAIHGAVQDTVELPVTDDELLGEILQETEPHGVVSLVEKQHPIFDELVLPQQQAPLRNRGKSLSRYSHLTDLTTEQFQDEKFLRSRIKEILSLPGVLDTHRNKLIQKLMMRSYYENLKNKTSEVKNQSDDDDVSSLVSSGEEDEVILSEQDLVPSFHSKELNIMGCPHYQRNCKIECFICNKWYPCRFCHDLEIHGHQLPRSKTRHILCMFCETPQLPSQICANINCGKVLSHYYCEKCKLFDNDLNKDIYHCDDCGICRLGQGLNQDFFHCKGCNACISIDLQNDHRCIENSTHSNCTICGEYMFSSIKPVVFMQCGHPIHQSCFDDHTKHSYKCPVCSKTIVNMEAQFRVLDQEISLQPLPEPYGNWRCIVQCNDCKAKSMVKYHILGLKCENCKSYNTTQLRIFKDEKELKTISDESEKLKNDTIIFPNDNMVDDQVEYEEEDDDGEYELEYESDNLGNLINQEALTSFEKYKEWFFSTMDSYLSQVENTIKEGNDFDDDSYEEDDYDDMR